MTYQPSYFSEGSAPTKMTYGARNLLESVIVLFGSEDQSTTTYTYYDDGSLASTEENGEIVTNE